MVTTFKNSIVTRNNPTLIGGNVAWLDCDESWKPSVTKRAGTFATNITDKSTGGVNSAAQASDILQPTFNPTALNGKGGLVFDGTKTMTLPTINSIVHTAFIISKITTTPTVSNIIYMNGNPSTNGWGVFADASNRNIIFGGRSVKADGPITLVPEIWTVEWNGTTSRMWVNGVEQSITNATWTMNIPAGGGTIGENFIGELYEIFIYDGILTDSQRNSLIFNYAKPKWAI